MRIQEDEKLDFDDVLVRPQRSSAASRKEVDVSRTFKLKNSGRDWSGIPVLAANMSTVGTLAMADAFSKHDMSVCLHKHYSKKELIAFLKKEENISQKHIFYTLGTGLKDREKLNQVSNQIPIRNICIDVANGYTDYFVDRVAETRQQFPDAIIMAGNVCTPDMVQELLLHGGADIVKIGIGPGSVCSTRLVAGIGYPQLSAIIECSDAAHGLNGHICADGGCKVPADIVKAFGAGADFVMLGGLLSGHDECEGDWTYESELGGYKGKKKKSLKFYGMSSSEAMNRYNGGVANYRASEGETIETPYRGPVEGTIYQMLGGLRSACAYVGAKRLKDLSKRTTFIKVNRVK